MITDCFVKAGFGVASSANSTDGFSLDTTGMDNATLAALPVLECPVGYFGAGGSAGAKCVACPAGTSTEAAGSTSAADCKGEFAHLLVAQCAYCSLTQGAGKWLLRLHPINT